MLAPGVKDVREVNGRRCRGHCCRRFYLPFTPEDLVETARAAWRGESGRDGWSAFAELIHMVIPLGPAEQGGWYTCAYHDPVSGNCLIYAHRPRICAEYPYGRACGYGRCAARSSLERLDLALARAEAWLAPWVAAWRDPAGRR